MRIEYEGVYHHVMARGDRREAIFLGEDQTRSNRIEMHVIQERAQIVSRRRSIALLHHRLVARPEDMAPETMSLVKTPRTGVLKPLRAAHPGMHTPARLFTDLTERVQKQRPIVASGKGKGLLDFLWSNWELVAGVAHPTDSNGQVVPLNYNATNDKHWAKIGGF